MRSRLAARSTRLALAVAAAAALAATATPAATADSGSTAARACATNDLTFKITSKTQAGGYLLVTAKAKSGITCYLRGVFPSASFGSAANTELRPVEHSVSDDVVLSGSAAAYAGINPKSTNDENGRLFEKLHLSVTGDEDNFVTLNLPHLVQVDRPLATNWHADPADAVPYS
ncbi:MULTISPECIES: DUF4232 domain-containing protein [Streptomyces]|nr:MULTISPECIES: DUF4232 domain-containing protein [Streptomyces]MDX2742287.1 DUF4232 domain-containing protein [Streptomyces sp. NRRL_B-2557]RPK83905.1 hypothetical protein EES45_05585 [Streptomyces sp. ADI97-07]WUC30874.1 DUF4232 domain-containing protein [Streptomyces clavifer]